MMVIISLQTYLSTEQTREQTTREHIFRLLAHLLASLKIELTRYVDSTFKEGVDYESCSTTPRRYHVHSSYSRPRHIASVSGMVGLMFTHHTRCSQTKDYQPKVQPNTCCEGSPLH